MAYKFKTLAGNSLISLPVFADQGCTITLDKDKIVVAKEGTTVMSGYRERTTGLWRVPLDDDDDTTVQTSNPQKTHTINSISPDGTVEEVLGFLSKALFSPTQSTLVKAIETGHLATWPLLTKANVIKFLPNSQETALGHLDQQRKNTRSTQPKAEEEYEEQPTAHVYAAIVDLPTTRGKIATDQTGRFPTTSSQGSTYVLILYNYDSNAILAEPIKSRHQHEILRAYKKLHQYLTDRGLKPQLQRLDNEASNLLKQEMTRG